MNTEKLGHNRMLLSSVYVTKGGKISKFGTVHILANSVPQEPFDEDAGLEIWAKALYDHRQGNCTAKCHQGDIIIVNENDETVAVALPGDELSACGKSWHKVEPGGWAIGEEGILAADILEALMMAEKGERPMFLDNSAIIKVLTAEVGSRVLALDVHDKTQYLVFSEDGEIMEHQELYPLSFKKWDPEHKYAKYSKE